MRKSRVVVVLILLILTVPGIADSKDPADYPLRIHIFNLNQTTFFRNRAVDEARGEGRANLFENGEARGIDFSYDCLEKIHPSFGFETYPAKWKKQGKNYSFFSLCLGRQIRTSPAN